MQYHIRMIEQKLRAYHNAFPCVLVAGARQVGKSTLLQHLFSDGAKMFTFDPVQDLYGARADPDLFLRNNPPPLILDEIQYVPELVPALKRYVDENRRPGLFLITGSQQWDVMRRLSESLAGRLAILELPPFSLSETHDEDRLCWLGAWLGSAGADPDGAASSLTRGASAGYSPAEAVWRGGFPEVQTLNADVVAGWMRGYVSSYLQSDVRTMLSVKDETQFASFLGLCAALTAQECNYSQMGRDIGLSTPTAQNWMGVLRGSFQWVEIPAFSQNQIKKLSQKPKGYLADTGLACYLLRLASRDALLGHPLFGSLFETFVALDLMKQAQRLSTVPAFYHFRQHSGAEVDLIADFNGKLFPIEIKSTSMVRPRDTMSISVFQAKMGDAAGPGIVVYAGNRVLRIGERCMAVPFDLRLEGEDALRFSQ